MCGEIIEAKSIEPIEFQEYELTKEKLTRMLEALLRIRRFEEKVEELYLDRGLLIGPAHLYFGQEAIATGVCSALKVDDIIISNHRGHGHAIAKGIPTKLIMAELFGKSTGTCKGLSGSMHVSIYLEKGALYSSAIVGSNIPIATGVGLALKRMKTDKVVAVFFGDGAVNTGAFHEGLNMASIMKVPVLFVCENNQYAISMKASRSVAARSIAERVAYSYNMPTFIVDGNDVLAVYRATKEAVRRIRKEKIPIFMECITYRMKGHGVYDMCKYRSPNEVESWKKRDPILIFKELLISSGIITKDEFEALDNIVKKEIEEAVEFSIKSPVLPFQELKKYVYFGGIP